MTNEDNFSVSGLVKKFISENAFVLDDGHIYSQFGGVEPEVKVGSVIKFQFKQKEKDGRIYNNIIEGSISFLPKEIKESDVRGAEVLQSPLSSRPDSNPFPIPLGKDRLIVRQSCLKSAVEVWNTLKSREESNGAVEIKLIAEEFEKWVFRE